MSNRHPLNNTTQTELNDAYDVGAWGTRFMVIVVGIAIIIGILTWGDHDMRACREHPNLKMCQDEGSNPNSSGYQDE